MLFLWDKSIIKTCFGFVHRKKYSSDFMDSAKVCSDRFGDSFYCNKDSLYFFPQAFIIAALVLQEEESLKAITTNFWHGLFFPKHTDPPNPLLFLPEGCHEIAFPALFYEGIEPRRILSEYTLASLLRIL